MSDFDRNATARWGAGVARAGAAEIDKGLRSYMLGVYNYMTVGLAVTGLVALGTNMLAVASDRASAVAQMGSIPLTSFGVALYGSPLRWLVMLAPLAFVFFFSFRLDRMAAQTARTVFILFAAAMGLSLSSILLVYTGASIASTFLITAASFGALSLAGYTTKKDLTGFGSFLIVGLFGIMIASVVSIFFHSPALIFMIDVLGVVIFAGLIAYDTQRLKMAFYQLGGDREAMAVTTNYGALSLYLNFINLFQFLLSIFGSRR
jgi:FtsH-binding integral membrane protein